MGKVIEIISRDIKDGDPYRGLLKIKDGNVVDYRYGMKKAKVIVHPVDLEGIIYVNDGEFQKKYKIKISYSSEDIFDLNKYMSYMKQKEIITTIGKISYVEKMRLKRAVFSDLEYLSSTDEIEDYFITELGVSPRVYKKMISKDLIEKLNKKVKEAKRYLKNLEEKTKEAEVIIRFAEKVVNYIPTSISSISELTKKYTGISFEDIVELSEEEANKYINKIATDVSTAYFQMYNDRIGARVVHSIIVAALSRARSNYYSDNIKDYLIINDNYDEIKQLIEENTKEEFLRIRLS